MKKLETCTEMMGWYGTFLILGAYALLSFGLLQPTNTSYQLINALGAVAIIIISRYKKNSAVVLLNIGWLAIALSALIRILF